MGIGRLEFLRLTGIALVGLTIDPLKAVAINDNAYVNKKLGILFHIPKDWGFVAVKDFGKLKSEQIIGKGDYETAEEFWEEFDDPICVATKYDQHKSEHDRAFSPTITLTVTQKEDFGELGNKLFTFEKLMEISLSETSKILKEFRVIKRHDPYYISNCKFYEYDAEYLFEHIELKEPVKVELTILKAEHNGLYYDFNCHQSKTVGEIADSEFEDFKKTIKLI